jgi:hypothetical protein
MDEQIEPTGAAGDQGVDPYPDDAPSAAADRDPTSAPVPAPPGPTGLPSVDSAVDRLAALEELHVEDHVEVFDDVQRRLHDSLAELDDEQ